MRFPRGFSLVCYIILSIILRKVITDFDPFGIDKVGKGKSFRHLPPLPPLSGPYLLFLGEMYVVEGGHLIVACDKVVVVWFGYCRHRSPTAAAAGLPNALALC